MTVLSTASSVTYQGNGATTVFTYAFLVPDPSYFVVTITNTAASPITTTVLTSGQYTYSGIGNSSGGTVTVLADPATGQPLAAGKSLTIARVVPITQATSIVNQSGFYPKVIEDALDKVTMQVQQIGTMVSQTVMAPTGTSPVDYFANCQAAATSASTSASAASTSATNAAASATSAAASAAASNTAPFTVTPNTAGGVVMTTAANKYPALDGSLITNIAFPTVPQIRSVTASVSGNALTVNYGGGNLDFRSATLTSGAVTSNVTVAANSITAPPGATLGTVSGQAAQLVLLEAYNGGSPVACIVNLAGGLQLDETNLISPTTISSGATAANVIYSASAVSANSPYRIVGYLTISESTAGTWATAPTLVQGCGGQALAALQSLGYGQTWQDVKGSRSLGTTYYNTTCRPIVVSITTIGTVSSSSTQLYLTVNGVPACSGGLIYGAGGLVIGPSVTAIVPPGSSYTASASQGSLSAWSEYR